MAQATHRATEAITGKAMVAMVAASVALATAGDTAEEATADMEVAMTSATRVEPMVRAMDPVAVDSNSTGTGTTTDHIMGTTGTTTADRAALEACHLQAAHTAATAPGKVTKA